MKYPLAEQFQTAEWSRPSCPPEYFVDYTREWQNPGKILKIMVPGEGVGFALRIT
jgi:hypothetical protein